MQRNSSISTNQQTLPPDRDQDPGTDYAAFYHNNPWLPSGQQPLYYVAVAGMPETGEGPALHPYPQYPVYFVPPEFAQYQFSNPGLVPLAQDRPFVTPQTTHPALVGGSPKQPHSPDLARQSGKRQVKRVEKSEVSTRRRTRNSSRAEPESPGHETKKARHDDTSIDESQNDYKRSRTTATFASTEEIQGFKNLIKLVAAALALDEVDTSEEVESCSAAAVLSDLRSPHPKNETATGLPTKTMERAKRKYQMYYASLERSGYSVNEAENVSSCIETSFVRGKSLVRATPQQTKQPVSADTDFDPPHYRSKEIAHPSGTHRVKRATELRAQLSQLDQLERENHEKIVKHSFATVEREIESLSKPLFSQADVEGVEVQAFQDTLRDLVERGKCESIGFRALREYSAHENLKALHETCLGLYGEMAEIVTGRLGTLKGLLLRQRELLEKPPQELGKEFYDVSSKNSGKVWRRFLNGTAEASKVDELSSIVSDSEFLTLTEKQKEDKENSKSSRGESFNTDSGSDTNAASGVDAYPSFTTRSGHSASRDWALNSIMKYYKAPSPLTNEEIEKDLLKLGKDLTKWKQQQQQQ